MLNLFPLMLGTLAAVMSTQAVPTSSPSSFSYSSALERRIVGSLSCKNQATGSLILYNTKTQATSPVTLANNYRLNDVLAGRKRPSNLRGIGNPRVLSSYFGASGQSFSFLACTESQRPGFEDLPAVAKNGTAYGHISGTSAYCLNHLSVFADEAYLVAEKCNYSDDSGSPPSYFSYDPSQDGMINFLGFTGKHGGIPHSPPGVYDFTPGTSAKEPAIGVHEGSPQFSDWVLRLQD